MEELVRVTVQVASLEIPVEVSAFCVIHADPHAHFC